MLKNHWLQWELNMSTHTILELETNKDIKKDQEAAPLQEMLQNSHSWKQFLS